MAERSGITVLNVLADERVGGPPLRVLRVAERLKHHGMNTVVVMPPGDHADLGRLLTEARIRWHAPRSLKRLPHTLGPHWLVSPTQLLRWLVWFLPGTISLVRIARKEKAQIVHVNGLVNFQAALAAKLARAKLVWHLNDTATPAIFRTMLRPLLQWWADQKVGAAEAMTHFYLGKNGTRRDVLILYPPVDAARFRPGLEITVYRREFGLSPEERLIGTVGNFDSVKGHDVLLRAATLVKERIPSCRFLMVGKSLETQRRYWRKIKCLIDEGRLGQDVILPGARNDIPGLMNLMDVFVLASTGGEAAPMVVLEAMACARPVVATNIAGIPELVADGETGILVPPRDRQALARAIVYLLEHPDIAAEMGRKGRQRAMQRFSLDRCVDRHLELYLSLVNGRAA